MNFNKKKKEIRASTCKTLKTSGKQVLLHTGIHDVKCAICLLLDHHVYVNMVNCPSACVYDTHLQVDS